MKAFFPAALITALAAAAPARAQVLHPDVRDRATNPPAANDSGDTVIQRQPEQKKPASSPFGSELPFFDPSSETVSWNGHNWAATDNRALAARFERYLNEPADLSEDALDYRQTIDQILELVSPHHTGGPDFPAAVKLLPRASSFPGDAKLCDSLTQAIYAAVLAKKDINTTRAMSAAMEDEKQRLIKKADWKAAHEKDPSLNATKRTGGDGGDGKDPGNAQGPAENPGRGVVSLEYVDSVKRVAEIEAMKKANSAKNELQITQAKMQYQSLMLQFFVQRRFEHVVMASRFYHQVFKDGDNHLHIEKNSEFNKLFTESLGASPTVAALDSLASEAIRDVDQGVEAFRFLVEKKEFQSAAKRLSEAYSVGEFMPSIRTLPREQKRAVLEFVRQSYKLIAAIDSKDYAGAKELVDQLKAMSGDFDATKPEAAIATYTRVSSMHIDSAKLAASKGDNEKAAQEIKNAMEVWPTNPKLAEFDRLVASGSDLAVASNDFDRLLAERNYREILNRQYEFAPAIKGDAAREDAFKQIITNLTRIEGALQQASEFSKRGQHFAAWEQLVALRKEFPDDPKLGVELEKLAPEVATFTQALNKAREFEERRDKQVGAAMSWYLKARSIHPHSDLAEEGIQRMLGEILGDGTPVRTASDSRESSEQ